MDRDQWLQAHKATHDRSDSWWLNDAKGIPLSRVCDACIDAVLDRYEPEMLGLRGRYEDVVEDPIEEE